MFAYDPNADSSTSHRKKKLIGKIILAGIVIAVVSSILTGNKTSSELPNNCKSDLILTDLRDIVSESPGFSDKAKILYIENAQKIKRSESELMCKAEFKFNFGDTQTRKYRFYKNDGEIYVELFPAESF